MEAFVAYDPTLPKDRLTVGKWGHYSRLGNTIVATCLQNHVKKEKLAVRDHVMTLVRSACITAHCCKNPTP